LAVDIINPIDGVVLSTTKSLKDVSALADDSTLSVDKAEADSQALADTTIRSVTKGLADTQAPTDAITAKSLTKALADFIAAPQDQPFLTTAKSFSDNTDGFEDGIQSKTLTKGLADSVTMSDVAIAVREFVRSFSEDAPLQDAYVSTFTAGNEAENLGSTDASSLQTSKGLTDSAILIDNMDGDLTYAFVKLTSELLEAQDAQVLDLSKQTSDNVLGEDAGFLIMQDYADITYFAEDYVGISRTFT